MRIRNLDENPIWPSAAPTGTTSSTRKEELYGSARAKSWWERLFKPLARARRADDPDGDPPLAVVSRAAPVDSSPSPDPSFAAPRSSPIAELARRERASTTENTGEAPTPTTTVASAPASGSPPETQAQPSSIEEPLSFEALIARIREAERRLSQHRARDRSGLIIDVETRRVDPGEKIR